MTATLNRPPPDGPEGDELLDALIPPPRPWSVRLLTGVVLLGVAVFVAWGFGWGHLRPNPHCCGNGSGSQTMFLAPDGESVIYTARLYNSSPRGVEVLAVNADVPGAELVRVEAFESDLEPDGERVATGTDGDSVTDSVSWTSTATLPSDRPRLPLPMTIPGHNSVEFAITVTPTDCSGSTWPDGSGSWGEVSGRLAVADASWPTLERTVIWPESGLVDGEGTNTGLRMGVLGADGTWGQLVDPLAAACDLLGEAS